VKLLPFRSDKLKPFWLSLHDDDTVTVRSMSDALLSPHTSPQYLSALKRALEMPQSKVIPFFGTFLRDLYSIFNEIPSLVVVTPKEKSKLEASWLIIECATDSLTIPTRFSSSTTTRVKTISAANSVWPGC